MPQTEQIIDDTDSAMLSGAEVVREGSASTPPTTPESSEVTTTEDKPSQQETREVEDKPKTTPVETAKDSKEAKNSKDSTPEGVSGLDKILGTDFLTKKTEEKSKEKSQEKSTEKVGEKAEDKSTEDKPKTEEIDLSEFGPQQQLWLRRMPSDARKYFSELIKTDKNNNESISTLNKKIKEISEGKNILPESWQDHPEAYKLSPEYAQLQSNLTLAEQIYQHYVSQKAKIAAGEDWQPLENEYDAQGRFTGRILIKEPRQTTRQDIVNIDELIADARQQVNALRNTTNSMRDEHKNRAETYKKSLVEIAKKYYPQFDDEKYEGNATIKQLDEELPKIGITKNNPAYDILVRSIATNYIFRNYILEQAKKSQITQTIKNDAIKAGPNSSNLAAGSGSTPTKKKLSIADYDKFMREG